MKDTFHILFNFKSERWSEAQQFFNAIGRPDLAEGPKQIFGYTFDLDSQSQLETFQQQAAQFEFTDSYTTRRDRRYTAKDLSAAPLLWVAVTLEPTGDGGSTYGTQFDLSQACSVCGSGARQASPLILKTGDLPAKAKVAVTNDSEILFQETVVQELLDSGFPQDVLNAVQASKENTPLPWRQLHPLADLPPMSPETRGIVREDGCPNCGRDGYFSDGEHPIVIQYDINDLDLNGLPPVVATWERFGNSQLRFPIEESHFAPPLIIVKQKIYQILRSLRLRGLDFTPIELTKRK